MALKDHNKWRISKLVIGDGEERYYVFWRPFFWPFWIQQTWESSLEKAEGYIKRSIRIRRFQVVSEAKESVIAMADKLNGQR